MPTLVVKDLPTQVALAVELWVVRQGEPKARQPFTWLHQALMDLLVRVGNHSQVIIFTTHMVVG